MDTVLAFDFGLRRIGVAVGQTLTATASPLVTIQVPGASPDWNLVDELISSWKPDALVVGLPLNIDGTEHQMTARCRGFANQLKKRYGLPVHLVDERLSSIEAEAKLVAERRHGAKRRKPGDLDKVAAQIILQSWLDSGLPSQ